MYVGVWLDVIVSEGLKFSKLFCLYGFLSLNKMCVILALFFYSSVFCNKFL
jgi:hypothetical protein